MTDLKKSVIGYLQENARYTNSQIASMVGVSENEIKSIIEELEKDGVIVKYTAIVNPEKYQQQGVDAIIQVKVKPQKLKGFDAFAEELCAYSEVEGLYLISGNFDLEIIIKAKDILEVSRFVSEKLSVVDGVIDVSTQFILKKYKIEGQPATLPDNERQVLL